MLCYNARRIAMGPYLARLKRLSLCEWKLREQSTLAGFTWTLLHPALIFLVLYVLFVKWMAPRHGDYAFYLLCGLVQWNFFATSTSYSLISLPRRSALLRNFALPIEVPVLASFLSVAMSHMLEVLILLVVLAISRKAAWTWAFLLPVEAVLMLLSAGISLLLASFYVSYRDMDRIWSIATTAGFFLTPVFYTLDIISPSRRQLLDLNPMAAILAMTRDILITGQPPPPRIFCILAVLSALIFAVGLRFIQRRRSVIMDEV